MSKTQKNKKVFRKDSRQEALSQHFPSDSLYGKQAFIDNLLAWITFFRRNYHRCAIDYLGIKLHIYQAVLLYMMGICNFIVVVASRATAKSFIIALYSCIKCILYPNSMIVMASGTKGQAKLLVSEKIEKELMPKSATLRHEIKNIRNNQNEVVVTFRNNSTITVVTSNDNSRGYRSTDIVREEFRQIPKFIDDSVLSPFQIIRQTPFIMDDYYAKIPELKEESTDIYISSSWFDNGHWMWRIVDQAYDEMLNDKPSCLFAFDEAVSLRHNIKTMSYFQREKVKQDRLTWLLEFMNVRLKENKSAFFTYSMLEQNRNCKQPFFPRTAIDVRTGRKNKYAIPKLQGEIRIVGADMAFVEGKQNDNSAFSLMRLLSESTTHKIEGSDEVVISNGYRRVLPYLTTIKGQEIKKQAIKIRQLYEDFEADYIVLDLRNSGIAVYDLLARPLYDPERHVEYPALKCMNDDKIAERIIVEGAEPRIYVINASSKLNSDIALDFRRVLAEKKIDFLMSFEEASEDYLPSIPEYNEAIDGDEAIFYERPFLETQALFSETTELVYEKRPDSGAIVIHEQGINTKDRYTSVSYTSWFASLLERDLISRDENYEYTTFIN